MTLIVSNKIAVCHQFFFFVFFKSYFNKELATGPQIPAGVGHHLKNVFFSFLFVFFYEKLNRQKRERGAYVTAEL